MGDRTPPSAAAPPLGVPHPSQQVRHAGTGCVGGPDTPPPAAPLTGAAAPPPAGSGPGNLSERARLAARQAELVDALVGRGPDPDGFDTARLAATRAALLRKRAGQAALAWPLLAAALGPDWARTFADRFAGVPPTDAVREGWDLARSLHERDLLPATAVAELMHREAALRYDGHSAPVRRPRLAAALRRGMQRR